MNAIDCFAGPIGLIAGVRLVEFGTVAGGFLYWLALFPLTLSFIHASTYEEEQ